MTNHHHKNLLVRCEKSEVWLPTQQLLSWSPVLKSCIDTISRYHWLTIISTWHQNSTSRTHQELQRLIVQTLRKSKHILRSYQLHIGLYSYNTQKTNYNLSRNNILSKILSQSILYCNRDINVRLHTIAPTFAPIIQFNLKKSVPEAWCSSTKVGTRSTNANAILMEESTSKKKNTIRVFRSMTINHPFNCFVMS